MILAKYQTGYWTVECPLRGCRTKLTPPPPRSVQSYNKGIVRGGKKFGPKYHLEIFISTHASDETKSENETIEAKVSFPTD